jgi:hypothetical protein
MEAFAASHARKDTHTHTLTCAFLHGNTHIYTYTPDGSFCSQLVSNGSTPNWVGSINTIPQRDTVAGEATARSSTCESACMCVCVCAHVCVRVCMQVFMRVCNREVQFGVRLKVWVCKLSRILTNHRNAVRKLLKVC